LSDYILATNLLRLRRNRGLTQEQVASAAGVSRAAYRNLEKGRAAPRTDTLKSLSRALEVPLKELLLPVEILHNVRFRSLKRLKSRDQVLADVSRWLRDFAELEALTRECHEHSLKPLWQEIARKRRKRIPEMAALVRDQFGLGVREPVHDICGLLESRGIKVYSIHVANDAFMGLSVAEDNGGPAIIVNTWERLPVETWIFSAAHELAHLLLHLSAYDVTQEQEDEAQEKEADKFASHFLMPEEAFLREWEDAAGLPLVDRVLKVKRVFRVSWRTVLYRVAERLPDDRRYEVWKLFNQTYREQKSRSLLKHDEPQGITEEVYKDTLGARPSGVEPAGMESHDFREDRLSRLVRRAVEQDIISLSRGAEILGLQLEQMRALAATWVA
jgi:Zn-dependent peptidase ImmA (M78 family)/DNA-binding XRE family transcriptional regulator